MSKFLAKYAESMRLIEGHRRFIGFIGQFMAFVAMMMPILSKNFESLSFLLIVSAISNLAVIPFTIACGHIVPSLKSSRRCFLAVQGALYISFGVFVLALLSSLFLYFFSFKSAAFVILAASFLTLAQATYSIVLAILVRSQNENSIFALRFIYGFSLIVLTGVAVCVGGAGEELVAAYVGATIIASCVIRSKNGVGVVFEIARKIRVPNIPLFFLIGRYFLRCSSIVSANLVATGAFQITAISVGYAGEFKAFWSVALRIVGGVGTTISQLIAPSMEGRFAFYLRTNLINEAKKIHLQSSAAGLMFGFCAFIAAYLGCIWVSWSANGGYSIDALFVLAILIFGVSVGVGAILSKFPGLLDIGEKYLKFAILKILMACIALSMTEGRLLILLLALIEVFYQISLLWAVRLKFGILVRNENNRR